VREELTDLQFTPLTFTFDADRDLAFTERTDDHTFWTDHRCAHPAWLASATNAIVRRNIGFGEPKQWTNVGLAFHLHRRIEHGATIVLTGRITDLFDRGRHQFAVATCTAMVEDRQAATLRNTFIYASTA
jgi:hypothetical protein